MGNVRVVAIMGSAGTVSRRTALLREVDYRAPERRRRLGRVMGNFSGWAVVPIRFMCRAVISVRDDAGGFQADPLVFVIEQFP